MSAYDFFVGYDSKTKTNRFSYSPSCFNAFLSEMPRVLAAFDSALGGCAHQPLHLSAAVPEYGPPRQQGRWGAQRPHHRGVVRPLVPPPRRARCPLRAQCGDCASIHRPSTRVSRPTCRPRVRITLADGTRVTPDYTVVAVDAPAAEIITSTLRAAGTGGTVAKLDGFTTFAPPPDGPLQPATTRPQQRRNPYTMDEIGTAAVGSVSNAVRHPVLLRHRVSAAARTHVVRRHGVGAVVDQPAGILGEATHSGPRRLRLGALSRHRGFQHPLHVILSTSPAGARRPATARPTKSPRRCGARSFPRSRATTTPSRRRRSRGPRGTHSTVACAWLRDPVRARAAWFATRLRTSFPSSATGTIGPAATPWNPQGSSWTSVPPEHLWLEDLEQRNVWQARHGGYQVHNNSVVFAGTWNKTFTRITSMEAACESGRHAVNAILDHYIWVAIGRSRSPGQDHPRLGVSLRLPRPGFVESGSAADTGR